MPNVTLFIQESLKNRLNKYPNIKKSELFQNAVEKKLELLEQLEKIEKTDIPSLYLESYLETIEQIKKEFEENSFEFGQYIFSTWMCEVGYTDIKKVASFEGKINIADELYNVILESFKHNNEINRFDWEILEKNFEEFIETEGVILYHSKFAEGFIFEAQRFLNFYKKNLYA